MIALDTETPGKAFRHGCQPFFITTHTGKKGALAKFWEWEVDPYTRRVKIPEGGVEDVGDYLFASGDSGPIGRRGEPDSGLIIQNAKFDVMALSTIGMWTYYDLREIWNDTHDILQGAHLLASNRPKDLTTLALQYLKVDIEPLEKELAEVTKAARSLCRTKWFKEKYGEWAIASEDRYDMPDAKTGDKLWKNDTWLPRQLALDVGLDVISEHREVDCSHWECTLRNYSNCDPITAAGVWKRIRAEMVERNLMKIYECRRKLLRVVYDMEERGVTVIESNLVKMEKEFAAESEKCGRICTNIAEDYGHALQLPKAGVNNNLRTFMFDVFQLEHLQGKKAKTDAPTLDKNAMQHYLVTLPVKSKALTFVSKLLAKRARDTALIFMSAYRRFWCEHPYAKGYYILNPSLNITSTDTLRMSSSNPNEQNIGKNGIDITCGRCLGEGCANCKDTGLVAVNLRFAFGPVPGREWGSADAKNIEARLPAVASGEVELIRLYENPKDPPYYGSSHLLNFHTIYPDIWGSELGKVCDNPKCCNGEVVDITRIGPHCKKKYAATWYQYCKNGGFAVQYGAIDKADGTGTADRAFHRPFSHRKLKQRFAKLETLNQGCIDYANEHGYIQTMPDKTVDPERGYPLLCTRIDWSNKVLETVPLNYYIQGTAMWWTAKAMLRVEEFFGQLNNGEEFAGKTWPDGYYITMQVHDELVFDMPSGEGKGEKPWNYNEPIWRECIRLMELGGDDIGIPTPVGYEYHANNWGEGVTLA